MEKIKEHCILGSHYLKSYTSDGADFTMLLHCLADSFKPIDVEIEEDTDRDMKIFGKKSIPYEEYIDNPGCVPFVYSDCFYCLYGTVGNSLVSVNVVEDQIRISSKNKDIEIEDVINPEKLKANLRRKASAIEAGAVIQERYKLITEIGRGGFSKQFSARDLKSEKAVIVRVINKAMLAHCTKPSASDNTFKTDEVLAKINHPGILKVYDTIEDDANIYIISQQLNGIGFAEYLKNTNAPSESQVIDWAKQICDILNCLASFNPPIVHRGISPGCFVLAPEKKLILAEFGTARFVTELQRSNDDLSLGVVGYAAPEQFGAASEVDCRADIYGLGAILHELLTGVDPKKPPYEKAPIRQCNPSVSKGMEYIVNKCLMKDVAERYQTPAELQNDLNNIENLPPEKGFFKKLFNK